MSYFKIITNPKAVYLTMDMIGDDSTPNSDAQMRLKEMVDETLDLATKVR